jgi:hypothetical protein
VTAVPKATRAAPPAQPSAAFAAINFAILHVVMACAYYSTSGVGVERTSLTGGSTITSLQTLVIPGISTIAPYTPFSGLALALHIVTGFGLALLFRFISSLDSHNAPDWTTRLNIAMVLWASAYALPAAAVFVTSNHWPLALYFADALFFFLSFSLAALLN